MRYQLHIGLLLAASSVAPLAAQDHANHGTGHLGRVVFPVSCNDEARSRFEPAMAMLHSFWWEQAPGAFRSVLAADSTCAMAHWGLALSAWGNPFTAGPAGEAMKQGAAHAERAGALGAPTPREQGFIAAVQALYRDHATTPSPARLRAYSDTLARAYRELPNDPELALYYALSLVATASPTDTTFTRQKQAAAIMNPLYARFPDHPGLAHYIIHANDSPRLASLGLDAARRYASIAPSAPHAQHMPSHIFIRLGLWDETVASNRKSYEAGVEYAKSQGIKGVFYHEFHAMDYMVYGMLQQGRDSAAAAAVQEGLAIIEVQGPSGLTRNYNRTAMEARLPLERGDWEAAAKLPIRDSLTAVVEMLSRYGRGIGAARLGRTAQLRDEIVELDRIVKQLKEGNDGYWAGIAEVKRQSLGAWVLLAQGDTAGALREARAAADREDVTEKHPVTPGELIPARELQADMHFTLGDYQAARVAYLATLERERGRARSLFGAARSAELGGDSTAAREGYRKFLEQMQAGDRRRPEIAVARALAAR
jgi:hypothetical protein